MDLIRLHGIKLNTTIGIHAWEQHQPQRVTLNLTLGLPYTPQAFEEDSLKGTIDYSSVVHDLQTWLAHHRCKLIEYLAEQIAKRLFDQFPIQWLSIEVSKPAILPNVETVSVYIERQRSPDPKS